jgi:hypothetical protein
MKDFRFYLEFEGAEAKRKGNHSGNVFARDLTITPHPSAGGYDIAEGYGADTHQPNAPVAWTSASVEYLRTNCKRISEAKAREIHPKLFAAMKAQAEVAAAAEARAKAA